MPTYEYRCDANGRVVEVSHKMAERLSTWAELCDRAGVDPGKTAASSPVTKLISRGFVNTGRTDSIVPPCESGAACCGGGMCEMN